MQHVLQVVQWKNGFLDVSDGLPNLGQDFRIFSLYIFIKEALEQRFIFRRNTRQGKKHHRPTSGNVARFVSSTAKYEKAST